MRDDERPGPLSWIRDAWRRHVEHRHAEGPMEPWQVALLILTLLGAAIGILLLR